MNESKMAGILCAGLIVAGALVFYQAYLPRSGQPRGNGNGNGNGNGIPYTPESPGVEHTFVDSDEAIQAELDRWTKEHGNNYFALESTPIVGSVQAQIIGSQSKIIKATIEQGGIAVSPQAQAAALAKSQAYAAQISPIVSVLQRTGQTGVSTALALSTLMQAGINAQAAVKAAKAAPGARTNVEQAMLLYGVK